MPTLTEDEQRECIGGTRYYDSSGSLIANIGPNDDMRVVGEQFKDESGNFSEAGLASNSVPLSSCSDEIKYGVMNTIAKDAKLSSGVSLHYFADENICGAYNKESGIMINTNAKIFNTGNYYDFYTTLKHEEQHMLTPNDAGSNWSEYEAYRTTVEDSNFSKTSALYQEKMLAQYNKYKKLVGL